MPLIHLVVYGKTGFMDRRTLNDRGPRDDSRFAVQQHKAEEITTKECYNKKRRQLDMRVNPTHSSYTGHFIDATRNPLTSPHPRAIKE